MITIVLPETAEGQVADTAIKNPTSESDGTSNGKTYTPMAVNVDGNYKGILYDFSGRNSYLRYASNEKEESLKLSV